MKCPPGGLVRATRWPLAIALLLGQACLARTVFVETEPGAMRMAADHPVVLLDPGDVDQVEPFATRGVLEVRMAEFERRDSFTAEAKAQAVRLGCDVVVPLDAYRMRVAVPNTMGPTYPWRLTTNGMIARQYLCGIRPSTEGDALETRERARQAAKHLKGEGQEEEFQCSAEPSIGTHIRTQSCP